MGKDPKSGSATLVYSEAAASKAAFSEITQHPLTIWPPAIGIAAGVGLVVLGVVSTPVAITIGSVCAAAGATNWAVRFFGGKNAYMQKHYARLHEEFDELKKKKVQQLSANLAKLGCDVGHEQVRQFEDKFQSFLKVLGRVLSPTELTYSRYVGNAEQLYQKGLENLEQIVTLLISVSEINRDRLNTAVESLKIRKGKTGAEERTLAAKLKQIELFDKAHQDIDALLATNEEALATIDGASQAALRVKEHSDSQSAGQTIEEAMQMLSDMITRANRKPSVVTLLEEDKKQTA